MAELVGSTEVTSIPVDEVIVAYIKIRDEIKEKDRQAKEEKARLQEQLSALEAWMLQKMEELGVDRLGANGVGTCFKTVSRKFRVADWDSILEFIRSNEQWSMLEKRISSTAVDGYETATGKLPPGVDVFTSLEVSFRRTK